MKDNSLKIGLLTNDRIIPDWVFDCLNKIRQSSFAELSLIVLKHSGSDQSKHFQSNDYRPSLIFSLYSRFEHLAFRPKPNAFEPKNIDALGLERLPQVLLYPNSPAGHNPNQSLEIIRSLHIDVLFKPGPEPVNSALASCAKYGVWSFHPSPANNNYTDFAGISEVLDAKGTTLVRLIKLKDKRSNDEILHASSFCTNENSINWNRHHYFWKASSILLSQLDQLYRLGPQKFFALAKIKQAKTGIEQQKHSGPPGNYEFFIRIVRLFWRFVKRKTAAWFYFNQWILLFDINGANNITNGSNHVAICTKNLKRIMPGNDRLWADPFIIERNNSYFVFFEEMLYKEQKGRIAVMEIDKNGKCHKPQKALERNHHLSYPFLFEEDDNLYMLPESSQNKSVDLYKCTDFPLGWEYSSNLLSNVEAADSTLFKHNNKYWLFTSAREHPAASINDNLYLFFSNSLENGIWHPHPLNPIVSCVEAARPAGRVFMKGNKIFRPAQNASKYYGYGIQIMEIIKLSEDEYEEKHVHSIHPGWSNDVIGTHTYNFSGQMTVIDALIKRKKFGR